MINKTAKKGLLIPASFGLEEEREFFLQTISSNKRKADTSKFDFGLESPYLRLELADEKSIEAVVERIMAYATFERKRPSIVSKRAAVDFAPMTDRNEIAERLGYESRGLWRNELVFSYLTPARLSNELIPRIYVEKFKAFDEEKSLVITTVESRRKDSWRMRKHEKHYKLENIVGLFPSNAEEKWVRYGATPAGSGVRIAIEELRRGEKPPLVSQPWNSK